METSNLLITRETFPCSDGFSMPAYLTRPAGDSKLPGLLFIYEVYGLTKEMQRVANDFAAAGYAVLIPDLFKRGSWFSCVRKCMADLKAGQGRNVQDLLDARQWLITRDFADPNHIAVIGFCLGGAFALVLAKTGLFYVAAPFYGYAPERLDGACPIVASYAARDKTTVPDFAKIKNEVQRLNIPNDLKLYPDVGHNFMNHPPNPVLGFIGSIAPIHGGYNAQAAADATERVLRFLRTHM